MLHHPQKHIRSVINLRLLGEHLYDPILHLLRTSRFRLMMIQVITSRHVVELPLKIAYCTVHSIDVLLAHPTLPHNRIEPFP